MDSGRWQRIQAIFHDACALEGSEREAFVQAACDEDTSLRLKVEGMLREDALGACVLDRDLAEVANELFHEGDDGARPRQIGRYRVEKRLGEGGMGVVYLAEREDLGARVAIKVLRDSWVSAERRLRFKKEQQFLASLEHPSIARLYDADTLSDGTPYFVMEYVEGASLLEYCAHHHATIEQRLSLFRAVCEAVQYAHGLALIHRDLKPANVLVKADGSVRLLDFGIAKQLASAEGDPFAEKTQGFSFMTPAYAAPEQLSGGAIGLYSDIYSLGVILYQLLTGERPFDLSKLTPQEAHALLTKQAPRRPSERTASPASGERPLSAAAWADLDVLVLSAMHPEPLRRYRSVDALIRDLDHFSRHEPLEARPDSLRYRLGKFIRRNRGKLALTGAVLVTVIGLVVFFTVRLSNARNAALAEVARTQRIERFMKRLFQGGEEQLGPSDDLRVVTLVDRGAREARALDGDPKVQAELFQTLGAIYGDLGRFEGAQGLLQGALDKRRALFGAESPEVAETLVALGLMRVEQARWDEAESLIKKAIAIDRRRLPPDHPALGRALSALGHAVIGRGNYAAAIPSLKEAARLFEGRGDQPLELRFTLSDQANAQFYLGHRAESKTLNLRLLEMDRKNLGEQHANVADDLINLACIAQEAGDYKESERLNRQALVITERWFGPDHYMTASNLTLLGRALNHEGGDVEADKLLRRALAINERVYPAAHPSISSTLNDLGIVARNLKHFDEAEAHWQRMLTIERALHGNQHERVGVALSNLASVAAERGDFVRGEQLLREALAIYAERGAPEHVRVGYARISLGHALLGQKRYAEAYVESRGGYDIMHKQGSSKASCLPQARKDLAEELTALGKPNEAARFRAEAAAKAE
jgi:serine/threonine-protein kinase